MKNSMMILAIGMFIGSTSAMASPKLPTVALQGHAPSGLKAAWEGSELLYVKSGQKVQRAQRVQKGTELVTATGKPLAVLTGKVVVKLKDNANAATVAAAHDLKVDWTGPANLVIFTGNDNTELLALVEQLQQDPQIERVKLDRAVDKQQPM